MGEARQLAIETCSADRSSAAVSNAADPGRDDVGLQVMLKGIRVDDWVFGVSSVSKDGFESPVASAVPGGAFKPWVKPAGT